MKYFIILFVLFTIPFACKNATDENQTKDKVYDSSIVFGNKSYPFQELSAPAKEQAMHWGIMEDFLSETKKMNGSNYEALRNHSERLREYTDSLFKKIPDTLNTNPINSRLLVLKTRADLLYQIAHQSNIDSLKLQNSIEKLNVALNNLILQLNGKFQKDNIDSQRKADEETELKKQKRFTDSVYKTEMADKKK